MSERTNVYSYTRAIYINVLILLFCFDAQYEIQFNIFSMLTDLLFQDELIANQILVWPLSCLLQFVSWCSRFLIHMWTNCWSLWQARWSLHITCISICCGAYSSSQFMGQNSRVALDLSCSCYVRFKKAWWQGRTVWAKCEYSRYKGCA